MEKKEVISIILAVLLMTISLFLFSKEVHVIDALTFSLIASIIIIGLSVYSKKIVAKKIDTKITISIISWQRFWIAKRDYFRKPIPAGLLFPLLFLLISNGFIKVLAFLQFQTQALVSKVSKQYGRLRFSTVTEWDECLIAFYSFVTIWVLAMVATILNSYFSFFPFQELAKYCLYYSAWNMIPLSRFDGGKIFFGSRPLYVSSLVILAITAIVVFI